MQKTYKKFFLKFCRMSFFCQIMAMFINSVVIISFLSSCNILFHNPIETFFISEKKIQKIDNIRKYYCQINTKKQKIRKLLYKSGVNLNEILKLIQTDVNLNNLKKGQKLFWKVDSSGKLLKLQWNVSNFQKKIYKNINNKFLISNFSSKFILVKKTIFIEKNSNFFRSALRSGLKKSEINSVIQAIQSQINFKKISKGSNFNLVFLHDLINKKNILLGVKAKNFGRKYYSIRGSNGNFYDLYGLKKNTCPINLSFLKKYRISSQFNLHRINPVTHLISHHLGVDLAMPQGTPILATSNGEIIKANFNKIAGFYIALKNKDNYVTRYLHLKKILVKLGEKVKIGQKIALSGNTGRTTGPHLHYEVWINNNAIDPMKLNFMSCKNMTEKEKKILKFLEKKFLLY